MTRFVFCEPGDSLCQGFRKENLMSSNPTSSLGCAPGFVVDPTLLSGTPLIPDAGITNGNVDALQPWISEVRAVTCNRTTLILDSSRNRPHHIHVRCRRQPASRPGAERQPHNEHLELRKSADARPQTGRKPVYHEL